MSVRVMSLVWQARFDGPVDKIVMLALADHASDDGGNIYPSVSTLAAKCDVTDRHVRRVIKRMVTRGLLIQDGRVGVNQGYVNRYRISLETLAPLTQGQATPGVRSVTPDVRSGKPSLTINEPSAPTAFADRAGARGDADETERAQANMSEGGNMTTTESLPAGTTTVLNSTRRLDPVTHAFDVTTAADRNERLLRRAKGAEPARDFAIQFYRLTGLTVVNTREWMTGAQQLHEACGGDWSVAAEAYRQLRGRVTIASPHSLVRTAAAVRSERARKPAPEVGVVYAPVFN